MEQNKDQVFQLSLTEIAFTISFILLLLLGYLVFGAQNELTEAQKMGTENNAQIGNLKEELLAAKEALREIGVVNPEDMISQLKDVQELRAERDQLKQRIADLEDQISALTELKQLLDSTVEKSQIQASKDAILSSLALQNAIQQAFGDQPTDSNSGSGASILERTLTAIATAKQVNELASKLDVAGKDSADLRGQVAFLRKRLDARGGRDYPPCWADEGGNIEFLFSVELKSDVVEVAPAWPPTREKDARALPGVTEALVGSAPLDTFEQRIQSIFEWSRNHDPECRHYVRLRSLISDAAQSDRSRLRVEKYFYKKEMPR